MEIDPVDVLREIERQFPKELMICVQAVQIRKLTEEENDTDDEQ
jgi:hypothetical protein